MNKILESYVIDIPTYNPFQERKQVQDILSEFIDSNASIELKTLICLKETLSELAYRLNVGEFYVYYTIDDALKGTINVTQFYDEFIEVKSRCDLDRIQFIGV